VVCVQETKAQVDQLADPVFRPQGYHCYYRDAEKKGYSGVALYSRVEPQAVVTGFGSREFDAEGRYLEAQDADVVCVQETKAQVDQLADPVFRPQGYHCYYCDAEKKGYSGVALYSRVEPQAVVTGFGSREFDAEGRYLEAQFKGLSVVSVYLPSGSSSEQRQQAKFRFLDQFMPHLRSLKRRRRDYVLCGDWNIAHQEIDLKNWRSNQKNSGFLPEERAWLDQLFGDVRYVDGFREVDERPEQYTWWSNRGQAWAKNVGWRIDYQVLSPGLQGSVQRADIYLTQRFSDHAPLTLELDL
jgi:exodeoxyribonuclease-3